MMRILLFIGCLLCLYGSTYSQQTIIGKVTDIETGKGVSGVQVIYKSPYKNKENNTRASTDLQGIYEIVLSEADSLVKGKVKPRKLLFDFVGMQPQTIIVDNLTDMLNVEMIPTYSETDIADVKLDVSSTRATNIFETPSTVTFIDRRTIQKYNFQTISEALKTVAGFDMLKTSGMLNIPTSRWIVQDHYANKVLIMINGVPTWSSVTGETAINRISIYDVERIEVLKGPGSVLYGTNAYAGAVNIVLKKSQYLGHNRVQTNAGVGIKGDFRAGANLIYSGQDIKLFVSGQSRNHHGDLRPIQDYKTDSLTRHYRDFREDNTFVINASYKNHSFLYNGFQNTWGTMITNNHRNAQGIDEGQRTEGHLLKYGYQRELNDKWLLKGGASFDYHDRRFPRSGDEAELISYVTGRRISAYAKGVFTYKNFDVEIGGDYDYRKSDRYDNYYVSKDSVAYGNNLTGRSAYEYSTFAQAGYKFWKLNLLLGTRFSKHELFGSNFSYRGTLVGQLSEKSSLKFIMGTSYRAPSLFENYMLTSTKGLTGNPNIRPERTRSMELAYLGSFGRLFVQALIYRANYLDEIQRSYNVAVDNFADGSQNTAKNEVTTYINGQAFGASGIEVELKFKGKKIDSFLNFNYIEASTGVDDFQFDASMIPFSHYMVDESFEDGYDAHIDFLPKVSATGGIMSDLYKGISLSLIGHYYSSMKGTYHEIPAQYIFDINLGFEHTWSRHHFRHNLSVKNLLDDITLFPDHVEHNTNALPWDMRRSINYTLLVDW